MLNLRRADHLPDCVFDMNRSEQKTAMLQRVRQIVSYCSCHYFDLRHGVETCEGVPVEQLGLEATVEHQAVEYQPTHPKLLRKLFSELPLQSHAYTLIDFGSGKGRVLLVASEFPFAKIIGIETSQRLHEIAVRNIGNYRSSRQPRRDIRAVCGNACDWKIDDTEESVFFFYNPFRAPFMAAMLAKIRSSLEYRPRDAFLIYVAPFHAQLIDQIPVFERYSTTPYSVTWRTRPGAPGSQPRFER